MAISYHASSLLTSRSPKKQNTETNLISREKKKSSRTRKCSGAGTAEGTRTPDLLVRSQLLYPTELLPHVVSLSLTTFE